MPWFSARHWVIKKIVLRAHKRWPNVDNSIWAISIRRNSLFERIAMSRMPSERALTRGYLHHSFIINGQVLVLNKGSISPQRLCGCVFGATGFIGHTLTWFWECKKKSFIVRIDSCCYVKCSTFLHALHVETPLIRYVNFYTDVRILRV